ncbi:MAG: bifunctional DNA primase/helicase [Lachnospiraceae bacterium]|nr:bifunctional DNA primase/helicase [Lachnospiraceae bacterium]
MYIFNKDDVYRFAQVVGQKTRVRGDELQFQWCPYCGGNGKDLWTFAINLKNGAHKCMRSSCDNKGNMVTLAQDFSEFSLGQADEYYKPKREFRSLPQPKEKIVPRSKAVEFLASRSISDEVAKEYEITVQKDNENVLVFPFYDEKGILQFIKYRKIDFDKEKDKCKEWSEKGTKPILFGMKQHVGDSVILTEGQLDMLAVATVGYKNALSVPLGCNGFTWIPYCWDFLNSKKEIIIFGDYQDGKITLLDEISKRFRCKIKHVREEDYKDCKDANEILIKYGKEYLKDCIKNAVEIPLKRVKELANVKSEDPFSVKKLKTGIQEIDKLLYGGIPFGNVTIIAGKRGDGKSTLASQFITQGIEQGYTPFIYSGELTAGNFKAWLDFQTAGSRFITERLNADGTPHYFITNSNRQKIDDWYRGKCYIYDNSIIEDDEKEDLLKTIEEAICQYGVNIVLIDNLMTAIDLDSSNSPKYDKQSDFVKKLARISQRYNILIMLVAHRRKQESSDSNDDVAGSSDITNLAGVVINYDRIKDEEETLVRNISLTKNRLFGKLSFSGFRMNFDEKSKRIYGIGGCDYQLSWNNEFIPATDYEQSMFK